MAKKKKEIEAGDLVIGSLVLCEDGQRREVEKLEAVLDPRGGVYLDSVTREWLVRYTDGHKELLSGSVQIAA